MTLDDVPADTLMTLTAELYRLFRFAHCNPACHACKKSIGVGSEFQLLSFKGKDEMLCKECTKDDLEVVHQASLGKKEKLLNGPHGRRTGHNGNGTNWMNSGYSRPSGQALGAE